MNIKEKLEKCETAWSKISQQQKLIFLGWLEKSFEELNSGTECYRVSTCPMWHRNSSDKMENLTLKNILNIIEKYDGEACRVCLIAKELLPTVEFAKSFGKKWENFCPCIMYGREKAMSLLSLAITRISTELAHLGG